MIKHKLLSAVSAMVLKGSVSAHADVTVTINGVATAAPNNGLTSAFATQSGYITQDLNGIAVSRLPAWYSGNGQVLALS